MNKVKILLATFCFFLLTSFGISAEERTTRILVTATEEATLSSEISAKVISIPVKAGSNFRKSDILIERAALARQQSRESSPRRSIAKVA